MKKVSVVLWKDTRKNTKGSYPIKIRLVHNRKEYRYGTDITVTDPEWEAINQMMLPSSFYKDHGLKKRIIEQKRSILLELLDQSKAIADSLRPFDIGLFEKALRDGTEDNGSVDVFELFEKKINSPIKLKTKKGYRTTVNKLKEFTGRRKFSFYELDQYFLRDFEEWLRNDRNYNGEYKKPYTSNSVGVQMRNIKTVFNDAIETDSRLRDYFPFGRRRYIPPQNRANKRSLNVDDLKKIMKFEFEEKNYELNLGLDLFKFSFLCSGMNLADISELELSNLNGDELSWIRKKPNTVNNPVTKTTTIFIPDAALELIAKYRNNSSGDYLFPILEPDMSESEKLNRKDRFAKKINKACEKVARRLDIESFTMISARHSYVMVCADAGINRYALQQTTSHTNTETLNNYIGEVGSKEKKKIKNLVSTLAY